MRHPYLLSGLWAQREGSEVVREPREQFFGWPMSECFGNTSVPAMKSLRLFSFLLCSFQVQLANQKAACQALPIVRAQGTVQCIASPTPHNTCKTAWRKTHHAVGALFGLAAQNGKKLRRCSSHLWLIMCCCSVISHQALTLPIL